MTTQTYKKRAVLTGGTLVVLLALTSLYCWWNTDVLGDDAYCDGKLASADAGSVLDSAGRISAVTTQVGTGSGRAEFRCTIERTSRFIGTGTQRLTLRTGTESGSFPFTTAVWKDPASRSYFTNGATGAVSGSGGYVVLPKACWSKVGAFQGSRIVVPDDGSVTTVEAAMDQGSADPAALARLLTGLAQKVATDAGCAEPEPARPPVLAAPSDPRDTDARAVCGLKGFSLPAATLPTAAAEPGTEQVNRATAHTWACDLALSGTSGARLSLAATSDPTTLEAVRNDSDAFEELPGGKGRATTNQALLKCDTSDVYFAARFNPEYKSLLMDRVRRAGDPASTAVRLEQTTFQAFLDSAAASYGCPRAPLPTK
ncbi:hypothetical protein ACIREE_12840 [Streptomyces sp. NPDC102467]|uniref:hypothetical protein n=1 Tax=Streptomyces sp. NPDC102467 TaxID=3366179 RepID=UPI00381DE3C7